MILSYLYTSDNLVCGCIMFVLAHKLAIRWYKNYEQARLSKAGTFFDYFYKNEGVLVIFCALHAPYFGVYTKEF